MTYLSKDFNSEDVDDICDDEKVRLTFVGTSQSTTIYSIRHGWQLPVGNIFSSLFTWYVAGSTDIAFRRQNFSIPTYTSRSRCHIEKCKNLRSKLVACQ